MAHPRNEFVAMAFHISHFD